MFSSANANITLTLDFIGLAGCPDAFFLRQAVEDLRILSHFKCPRARDRCKKEAVLSDGLPRTFCRRFYGVNFIRKMSLLPAVVKFAPLKSPPAVVPATMVLPEPSTTTA